MTSTVVTFKFGMSVAKGDIMFKTSAFLLRSLRAAFAIIGGALVLTGAARGETVKGTVADALRETLDAAAQSAPYMDDYLAIQRFYANRDFRTFWYTQTGPTRNASDLIAVMADAGNWGLRSEDFALSEAARDLAGTHKTPDQTARVEYELMSAVLRYARHASGGRIMQPAQDLSDYLDRTPQLPDSLDVVARVTGTDQPGAALRAFHPQNEQFKKLQAYYAKARSQADEPKSARIAARGPMLVPGRSYDEIKTLRARMGLAASSDETLYDDDLKTAVRAFQRANGLSVDGLVGNSTRSALNRRSAGVNLDAVVASMENWRWMPRDLGRTHVLVNIPSYSVHVVEDGKTTLTERIIVGKPGTPTPVFSKPMTTIVLRPSWYLPDSIKIEKLLSAARRGRSLESQGIVVKKGKRTVKSWQVNWEKAKLSAYQIYQPSGDDNALGNVKFLFPNKHSVYLHDTPNKSLFKASDRRFSHGCVRLNDPLSFAQKVLDLDKGEGSFNAARLADSGPSNNEISLDTPLPVHIGYFTAWIDDNGNAEFYEDGYGHDKRVTLALAGRWKEIDKGPRHQTVPDSGVLAGARLPSAPGNKTAAVGDATANNSKKFIPPFGLLNAPPTKSYTPRRNTVGDMMTSAFAR